MVKELDGVYYKKVMVHDNEQEHTLNKDAKERITNNLQERESNSCPKVEQNILKLVLSFHLLYHRLRQCLYAVTPPEPTPLAVDLDTVEIAINYHDFLITTCHSIKVDKTILASAGPFITRCTTHMAYPSSKRPSSEAM